ncbi:type IV secretory system conjugative DNA transfer family protein [Oricola indica]|uniref:type IV secretory system conjugative DNA transfer family protein n=1 Tax=Oricola indica TaxID=2872591 RepID=UPI003CCB9BC7
MKRRHFWRMEIGLLKTVDPSTREFVYVPVINDRRFSHAWVIGKTGVGKSTALIRWALDDICAGDGIAFFDPHGDTAEEIIARIPRRRRGDVIWFNPAEIPVGFNIFDTIPEERKAFVASSVVDSFKSVWGYEDLATPALEQFLFNGARAMMDVPDGTLFGLKFLLTSSHYRHRVVSHVRDAVIADFWRRDFEEHMPEREQRERTLSTLNKIGALIADPAIRNCIAQPNSKLDFARILAEGKILIVSLPQGRLGVEKSALIGSLLLSQLQLAALSRQGERRPFHVYVDECHHFAAGTLSEMLSGIRKFGVSLTLSHQYLGQLSRKLKSALMGTAGTTIVFRIGVEDAAVLEPEFRLTNSDLSLCELPPFEIYLRDGYRTRRLIMPECPYPPSSKGAERIKRFTQSQFACDPLRLDAKLRRFVANAYEQPLPRRSIDGW